VKLERDKYLVEDEYKRILYAARTRPHVHAARDFAMLAAGGLCGLRVSELIGLRPGDLSRVEERPAVIGVWTAKQRGGRRYDEVATPATAALALVKYLRTLRGDAREPWSRLFPLTARQANRLFKRYALLAGLSANYSIHALRHFRGVQLYSETHDINLVREALRHEDIRSTMIYVHTVDHAEKAGAIDVTLD